MLQPPSICSMRTSLTDQYVAGGLYSAPSLASLHPEGVSAHHVTPQQAANGSRHDGPRRRSIVHRPSFTITHNHRRTVTPTIGASIPPPKPPCSTVWLFATIGPKGSLPRPMGANAHQKPQTPWSRPETGKIIHISPDYCSKWATRAAAPPTFRVQVEIHHFILTSCFFNLSTAHSLFSHISFLGIGRPQRPAWIALTLRFGLLLCIPARWQSKHGYCNAPSRFMDGPLLEMVTGRSNRTFCMALTWLQCNVKL